MRHFPRTARRRVLAASSVVALALTTAGPATPLASADDLHDKKRRVERKVDRAEHALDSSSARLRRANARLDQAQARLDDARTRLATARGKLAVAVERDRAMQAELEAAEAALEAAREELASGRHDMADQREAVVDTVTDFYQQGDPDILAISSYLRSETPADLTRRAQLRDAIVGRETRAFDELRAAEVLLEVRREQVRQARDTVAEKRAAAAANLEEKQRLEAEAEEASAEVRSIVGERADARSAASKARAADLRKLRQAQAEQDRIEEMLRRRAAAALRRSRGASAPSDGGYLDWPTGGPVSSPFGMRTHPIYGYRGLHDGADFAPGCGAALVAAAPGRVVSSYWSDVYGRRLVIDHGAVDGVGLATVYNHAASYTVGVGAQVSRGQTIGYVGNSGWSTGCHLHFTVMENGRPVAPFDWI